MKTQFFACALLLSTIPLQAQWELSPELSADYECTIGTYDLYDFSTGGPQGHTQIQDTLYFTLRRTIEKKKKQFSIRYKIQDHLNYGSFRFQKPDFDKSFPTDQYGSLSSEYYQRNSPEALDALRGKIHDFLRLTLMPYPKEEMRAGLEWTMPFSYGIRSNGELIRNNQQAKFKVRGKSQKYGHECLQVLVQCGSPGFGKNTRFTGDLFYDIQTGQLVYLELTGESTILSLPLTGKNTLVEKFRVRLALLPESTLLSEKTKDFEAAEAERQRLIKHYTWTTPPQYHEIKAFDWENPEFGQWCTRNGKFGFLDQHGKEILPPVYKFVTASASGSVFVFGDNDLWTMYSKDGVILMDSLIGFEREGKERTLARRKDQFLWLGVDGTVYARFDSREGIDYAALPADFLKIHQAKRYGILDKKGNTFLPVEYEEIEVVRDYFNNKLYFIAWNAPYSIVFDDQGSVLDTLEYQIQSPFVLGPLLAVKNNTEESTTTLRNLKTHIEFTLPCTNLFQSSTENCVCHKVRDNGNLGAMIFDFSGKLVQQSDEYFSEIEQWNADGTKKSSLTKISIQDSQGMKRGWKDDRGNWVMEPRHFVEGIDGFGRYRIFDSKRRFGLLDAQMDTIFPCLYQEIQTIAFDRYIVTDQQRRKFIRNQAGTLSVPIPASYTIFKSFVFDQQTYISYENKDKKAGLVNDQLEAIIKPEFDEIFLGDPFVIPEFVQIKIGGYYGLLKWPVSTN